MGGRDVKALVDTSAFYALWVAEDNNHEAAVSCFEQLRLNEAQLISTNYVLLECASLVQRRHGFDVAKKVLAKATELVDVVWMTRGTHQQAVLLWNDAGRRALSLVDCASFAVMRELGVTRAVVFDAHFAQAGFEVLPRADRVAERASGYRAPRKRQPSRS